LEDGSLIDSDPSATPDGSDVQKVIKEFNAANDGTSSTIINNILSFNQLIALK
jgi:hypothetical protein